MRGACTRTCVRSRHDGVRGARFGPPLARAAPEEAAAADDDGASALPPCSALGHAQATRLHTRALLWRLRVSPARGCGVREKETRNTGGVEAHVKAVHPPCTPHQRDPRVRYVGSRCFLYQTQGLRARCRISGV